jgi:hypothetical protein
MEYKFSDADFANATQVNIEQLQDEVNTSAIVPNVTSMALEDFTSSFEVTVTFDGVISVEEEAILVDIITNYEYRGYKDTVAVLKDVKSPGTNGGTFTSYTWITRELNTLIGDVNFVALNNNEFTITEGVYNISIISPACNVKNHQVRLHNVTTAADVEYGTSEYTTNGIVSNSTLNTIVKLTETNAFKVQHICYETTQNIGLGKATGFAVSEVYCTITIHKLI